MSSDYLPHTLDFLARFGVQIGFGDPECETVEIRAWDISADEMIEALAEYKEALKRHLYLNRKRALAVCVGGPKNGQPYAPGWRPKGQVLTYHLTRARWAVYQVGDDGRAWFRGYATSQAKGRKLQVPSDKK